MAGTFGSIQLVIMVNIEDKIVKGIERQLKAITINFWKLTESKQLKSWAGKDSNLNCLMHIDGFNGLARVVSASLADKYQYIFFQKDIKLYWKYVVL